MRRLRVATAAVLPPGQVWEVCRDRNYRNCLQVNTDGRRCDS